MCNAQKCSDFNKEHTLLIRSELKVIANTEGITAKSESLLLHWVWFFWFFKILLLFFGGLKLMKGEKEPMEHEWKPN